MCEISKCWNKLQVTLMKKNYPNLSENSSDFRNNVGRLFFEKPCMIPTFLKIFRLCISDKVKGDVMRNLRGIFLYEDDDTNRFSYLH